MLIKKTISQSYCKLNKEMRWSGKLPKMLSQFTGKANKHHRGHITQWPG